MDNVAWTKAKPWAQASDEEVLSHLTSMLAQAEQKDPFAVLGLGSPSTKEQLRAAFLTATKTYHPNRFARRSDTIRDVANRLFVRMKKAYEQALEKAPVSSHSAPPAPAAPPLSENRAVRRRVTAPRWPVRTRMGPKPPCTPESIVEEVSKREQDREKQFEMALAKLMRGECEAARKCFHQLAAECPSEKKYRAYMHYARGREWAAANEHSRAVAEYQRALSLEPELQMARSAMNNLSKKKERGRGLLSKLFGK